MYYKVGSMDLSHEIRALIKNILEEICGMYDKEEFKELLLRKRSIMKIDISERQLEEYFHLYHIYLNNLTVQPYWIDYVLSPIITTDLKVHLALIKANPNCMDTLYPL